MDRGTMILLDRRSGENARSYATRVLRHNIIALEMRPGSAINEKDIAALLGVSRTPVREAIMELRRVGLVEVQPQSGSYVTKIDYNIIEESRFLRLAVESAVMKLLCEQISAENLQALKANLLEQETCNQKEDAVRFLRLDNDFHELIFKAAGKSWSYGIIKDQMVHFDRLRALSISALDPEGLLKDHQDLVYAIERGDGEMGEFLIARHLSRHHIQREELQKKFPQYFV